MYLGTFYRLAVVKFEMKVSESEIYLVSKVSCKIIVLPG